MKYALSPLAFALGASAAALKRPDCCFQLTASGGASGTVGQLNDGQNRVGGSYGAARYCINSAGGITDAHGRGCILTPPTTQFQCDQGASPTTGFSVGNGGEVTYKGSPQFYACPAADGEYNIYTKPVDGQAKCVKITLSTQGKCASGGGQTPSASTPVPVSTSAPVGASTPVTSSPPPAGTSPSPSAPAGSGGATPPVPTSTPGSPQSSIVPSAPPVESPPPAQSTPQPQPQPTQPAGTPSQPPAGTTPSSSACPANLAGDYQYPHLIVPVNASAPGTAYGTQYNATVSRGVCSVFNFDIPAGWAGATCSAVFLLPAKRELETSDYSLSGSGRVAFDKLSAPASGATTWESVPAKDGGLGSWGLEAGKRFVVESGACEAGRTVAYEACGEGGLALEWFQDWNPSPIGLFVRKC